MWPRICGTGFDSPDNIVKMIKKASLYVVVVAGLTLLVGCGSDNAPILPPKGASWAGDLSKRPKNIQQMIANGNAHSPTPLNLKDAPKGN